MIEENIIKDNEKLIYSIINKYTVYYDKDDLYQVASIGLVNAYRKFDNNKEVKFTSYAYNYILGEVIKYIREDRNIKVSKDIFKLQKSIQKTRELLAQKLMRTPTDHEVALFLEIDEAKIIEVNQAVSFINSLDNPIKEDEKQIDLYDVIGDEDKDIDLSIIALKEELKKLSLEEKKLIVSRYFEDKTQAETSKTIGISQVQVSRKETKILQKLKVNLN